MKSISIIIPCYNEEDSLAQLFQKLTYLEGNLNSKYFIKFIFVNDGSIDRTAEILEEKKNLLQNITIHHHLKNLNLGAAIKSGIKLSQDSDFIVFLDSDCTYDPLIINELIKSLENGYDLVTVSPYHPRGFVEGVPKWRLFLSKTLSAIYQAITLTDYFTFTAMVRAVRKDKMNFIISPANDFAFFADSFLRSIRLKFKIAEVPATLGVRKFGYSKMRLIGTIKSHVIIILKILGGRL